MLACKDDESNAVAIAIAHSHAQKEDREINYLHMLERM